jgi:protein-S-isoprenylcysteine O-methyltransferase Ste14
MPGLGPEAAIYLVWLVWVVSWIVAAAWSSRAQSRPGLGVEAAYRGLHVVGIVLLFFTASHAPGATGRPWEPRFTVPMPPAWTPPLWTLPRAAAWGCVALSIAGFAFAWWARIHLGTLWSGSITRKADHRIVDTGPYGLVRHPIYTGVILALVGLAAMKATPAALLGAALITLSFWLKARFEEGFLSAELGQEAYAAYRRRVPMLVPFSPV